MFYFCNRNFTKMIQRIQSIYLLLASAISGGFIFVFNLWSTVNRTKVFAFDLLQQDSFIEKLIPILFIVAALDAFLAIFLFKNRKLQFVVTRLVILTHLILLGILIYLSLTLSGEAMVSEKGIGMFLPILVILLSVLANKAIKKDENLVKSVDRLR